MEQRKKNWLGEYDSQEIDSCIYQILLWKKNIWEVNRKKRNFNFFFLNSHTSRKKRNWTSVSHHVGFPGGSVVKNPTANSGEVGSAPGLRRSPWGGNHNPLQYSCLGNPRSLVGYSPWGRKGSDMMKRVKLPLWPQIV